jgi:hypothetical protein
MGTPETTQPVEGPVQEPETQVREDAPTAVFDPIDMPDWARSNEGTNGEEEKDENPLDSPTNPR